MGPALYNLPDAYRGDSYGPITFRFRNQATDTYLDFSSARIDVQVRNKRFKDVIILNWSTENSSIEIQNDYIVLKQISGENMKVPPGAYPYDMQIIMDGIITTYLKGSINVLKDITEI